LLGIRDVSFFSFSFENDGLSWPGGTILKVDFKNTVSKEASP